ncbi:MAG: Gfo/Idh/MocA family protein [Armatimonadota bacterium]
MDLRAAIIGLGNISHTHIAGWKEAEGVQPVAGADVNEAAVAAAVEKHGISGYTDWREMLDAERPDLVSICTPPFLHPEMAIECLKRGIHVLCEKPMAADVAGAERMAEAAAQAEAVLAIAYCHRFHGPAMRLKELIDQGILGRPLYFRGAFTGTANMEADHRASKAQAGGGALMDNGSHAADLYQYFLGRIANVSCRAGTFLQRMETDDVAVMLFEGENGCFGEVLVGYSLPAQLTDWRIAGADGLLLLEDYGSGPVRFWSRATGEWTDYECDNSQTRFQRQFVHFVECIRTGRQPRSNAETALHTQRAIGAAYQAAEQKGVPVPL